jgi:hypothetical protein
MKAAPAMQAPDNQRPHAEEDGWTTGFCDNDGVTVDTRTEALFRLVVSHVKRPPPLSPGVA